MYYWVLASSLYMQCLPDGSLFRAAPIFQILRSFLLPCWVMFNLTYPEQVTCHMGCRRVTGLGCHAAHGFTLGADEKSFPSFLDPSQASLGKLLTPAQSQLGGCSQGPVHLSLTWVMAWQLGFPTGHNQYLVSNGNLNQLGCQYFPSFL